MLPYLHSKWVLMSFYKFKADYIFDGIRFLAPDTVLICDTDGRIIALTDEKNIDPADLQYYKGILTPGLINTHCHLELSYLAGKIPKHIGLSKFLLEVITKRHLFYNPETIDEQILQTLMQMNKRGIVAVGDICNTTFALKSKLESPHIYFHNFIECIGFERPITLQKWQVFEKTFTQYHLPVWHMSTSYAPHAPYSVSDDLLRHLGNITTHKITTMHNQESDAENQLYQNKTGDFITFYNEVGIPYADFKATGKSSLQSVFYHFEKAQKIILVHNNATKESDIAWLKKTQAEEKIYFALCPSANLYIANVLPPVPLLRQSELNITLGTDSLASNETLCLLREMRILQEKFSVPTEELLTWATSNGAAALNRENTLGRFKENTRPGIVHISNVANLKFTPQSAIQKIL